MTELDALRAQVVALQARLDALEAATPVAAPAGPPAVPAPVTRRVSRRGLLAAAVAGGAGIVSAQVTTAAPAAAAPGNALVLGAANNGVTSITSVSSDPGLNSSPFAVINPNTGLTGVGLYAQLGSRTDHFDGSGGQRAAVVGDSYSNSGVTGLSVVGAGVFGSSDYAGVDGTGGLYGVIGRTGAANGAAVYAVNVDAGHGVYGFSSSGTAVEGVSSGGYGVQAQGARAPLRLVPAATPGAPKKGVHQLGELLVDRAGALFLCVRAGKPGTWRKIALA